ncbi:hypothetical protein LCGC14_1585960 [marine sediment metagenome]|uniref:Uncharacterized protein n=1 Tax=marine sediment metagenome TaxID=412755 RepID=A0A0F9IFD6_9ZZZZ
MKPKGVLHHPREINSRRRSYGRTIRNRYATRLPMVGLVAVVATATDTGGG